MSVSMKQLGIEALTPEQKVALALEIWESLGTDRPSTRLTPRQVDELDRRDAELEGNPASALSWAEIRASLEDRR